MEDAVATQPPCSMVMSPPGSTHVVGLSSGLNQFDVAAGAGPLLQPRTSDVIHISSSAHLLPPEQHVRGGETTAAASAQLSQQQVVKDTDAGSGTPAWLDGGVASALTSAMRTSGPAGPASLCSAGLPAVNDASDGCMALAALSVPDARRPFYAAAAKGPAAPKGSLTPEAAQRPTSAFTAQSVASAAIAAPPNSMKGVIPGASVTASIADRIQALKRELGEGEGVSALLERAKQQGMAPVAAVEDDGLFSDDELSNRPMSPLSRLRYDTFGATLDFVDALCYASSSLTNYSQARTQQTSRGSGSGIAERVGPSLGHLPPLVLLP